jgi:uncharacterized protein
MKTGNMLFIGDWESLAMVHLEIPADELQRTVPFELDLFEGSAFVSLVFFTMRRMRLAWGPRILNLLFYPFREQRFLNVRTYVRHHGEAGIHFITEWISNRVCARLGPRLYSLPYRWGSHQMTLARNIFRARVTDMATKSRLDCEMKLTRPFVRCEPGSREEFFFERYAAFNTHGPAPKMFRVSHLPWEQCRAETDMLDDSLLRTCFPWFSQARLAGANYSPGVRDVRMGWPKSLYEAASTGIICPIGTCSDSEILAGSSRTLWPSCQGQVVGLHRGELQARR